MLNKAPAASRLQASQAVIAKGASWPRPRVGFNCMWAGVANGLPGIASLIQDVLVVCSHPSLCLFEMIAPAIVLHESRVKCRALELTDTPR
jgi:hypothetical protein